MARSVRGVRKAYGDMVVLDGLDLEFPDDSVSVILGPSGCGKTTLLNILAGLDEEYGGEAAGFERGSSSYVFQEDRLLPWMSAAGNIAFILKPLLGEAEAQKAAVGALEAVGLGDSAEAMPGALSGGMKRRVAIARAFAYPSSVILLDEPFAALDLKTRIGVMDLFLSMRKRDGRTAIVVTHDVREAIYLGDRVTTLSDKPAAARDEFDLVLRREQRAYSSGEAAEIEARLYASILG